MWPNGKAEGFDPSIVGSIPTIPLCSDGGNGLRKGLKILRNFVPCRFKSGSEHLI